MLRQSGFDDDMDQYDENDPGEQSSQLVSQWLSQHAEIAVINDGVDKSCDDAEIVDEDPDTLDRLTQPANDDAADRGFGGSKLSSAAAGSEQEHRGSSHSREGEQLHGPGSPMRSASQPVIIGPRRETERIVCNVRTAKAVPWSAAGVRPATIAPAGPAEAAARNMPMPSRTSCAAPGSSVKAAVIVSAQPRQ
jgi:hypothetical protein